MNIFKGPKFVDFLGKILGFSKQFFLVGPLDFIKPLDQKLLIFQQKAMKNLLKKLLLFNTLHDKNQSVCNKKL